MQQYREPWQNFGPESGLFSCNSCNDFHRMINARRELSGNATLQDTRGWLVVTRLALMRSSSATLQRNSLRFVAVTLHLLMLTKESAVHSVCLHNSLPRLSMPETTAQASACTCVRGQLFELSSIQSVLRLRRTSRTTLTLECPPAGSKAGMLLCPREKAYFAFVNTRFISLT